MSGLSRSWAKGRMVGVGIVLALGIAYIAGNELVSLTAHAGNRGFLLWIHDGDVAPGGAIAVRVKRESVFEGPVGGVSIRFAGERDYLPVAGSDVVDFDVAVPDNARAGIDLRLTIGTGRAEWTRTVHVHSPAIARWRKIGRATVAIAIALVLAAAIAAITRFGFRRGWPASRRWYLLAIPHVVLGYVAFSAPLAAAVGTHAIAFHITTLVVWSAVLLAPGRARLRRGLPRYVAVSAALPHDADAPYRAANIKEVIESLATLEAAWSATGMLVLRRRDELVMTLNNVGAAVVPIPRSEVYGAEPLEVFTQQRPMADAILQAAANVLGPLRAAPPDATRELVYERA